jgi:vacuolar iron transporter family protein
MTFREMAAKHPKMPQIPHVEKHFNAPMVVRDIVIGMSDGLTVPFALAAGLSSAVDSNGIIVTAGLAEITAGAIAMGLGGYLAARTDAEHFNSEQEREERETEEIPQMEAEEVAQVFRGYGVPPDSIKTIVDAIRSDRKRWVDFMMRFELGLDPPDPRRARQSALTIGFAYIAGGLIPLFPYFLISSPPTALLTSVAVTLGALFTFGYVKGRFTTVSRPFRSAFQTLFVGALAASIAFAIARFLHNN